MRKKKAKFNGQDFFREMATEQRSICERLVLDRDTLTWYKVIEAPARIFEMMRWELSQFNLTAEEKHRKCSAAAKNYARAERSDPFAYARAYSHMTNGVCTYDDYGADFDVKIVSGATVGERILQTTVKNVRRP